MRLLMGSALVVLVSMTASTEGDMRRIDDDRSADEEILRVIEAFNAAFAANDVDRYFTFIDEDITVLTPSNPYRVEGVPDDRDEFVWGIETGQSRVGYFQELQPHVQRYGDVAVVTYFSRGAYGPKGEQKVAYLKETDVLVLREEGWKIVHIHVSATN